MAEANMEHDRLVGIATDIETEHASGEHRKKSMPNSMVRAFAGVFACMAWTSPAFPADSITPQGVGPIKLGALYTDLRGKGLVGPIGVRCGELSGPDDRAAELLRPLKGSVSFTSSKPWRVEDISIQGGATARGIGVGATSQALKAAYPAARYSPDKTFGLIFVSVPRGKGGPLAFGVNMDTKRVQEIAVPRITVCD
jgi:hypothetical protein